MGLLDLLKEHQSKKIYTDSLDDAMNHFIQQKRAIDGIKDTKWFAEIRQYRQRVVLACNERLRTVKGEDIKMEQGQLNMAMEFLEFLDNVLAEELDKEDLALLK